MNCQAIFILLLTLFSFGSVSSARILCVFSGPSVSHQNVYQPLWRELSLRGHDLVVLTTDPLNDATLKNLQEISWKEAYVPMRELSDFFVEPKNFIAMLKKFEEVTKRIAHIELSHPEVQRLIHNETEHFDLVIVEWYFPPMYAFKERFNCPMIGIASAGVQTIGYGGVGNPVHPAYSPDMFLSFIPPLNLVERIASTLFIVWNTLFYNYYQIPKEDVWVRQYFGNDMPTLLDIERKVDLLLLNLNPVLHTVRPNVPAVIELGGLQLKKRKDPLPEELQTYLDQTKEGVIYFSLGSNVKSSALSKEKINVVLEALSELPYKVLWKWESDELPNKPDNVKISKWLPQQDVFGHPNIKLFITQCGLQSLEEAIHNHIPIVGIPFFGDQPYNAKLIEKHGIGRKIDFASITKESFKNIIMDVITNPHYKENITKLENRMSDKPMSSLDTAIWWIEYVLRHGGAQHLRSPSLDVPLYQYFLLDVMFVLLLSVYCAYKLLKLCIFVSIKLFGKLFRRSIPSTVKNKTA